MKHRVFIAINPPAEIMNSINNTFKRLTPKFSEVSWINPDNFHMTLAFLDNINENETAKITALLKILSKNFRTFVTKFGVTELVPNSQAPKFIWIRPLENLFILNLEKSINRQIRLSGFNASDKYFIPHFTIARIKSKLKSEELLKRELGKINIPDFVVDHLDVMDSTRVQGKPVYKRLFRIPINTN